jgi:hypothetical protein
MGGKAEVQWLGLLGMFMGVQPFGAAHWQINRRNEAALRAAARQGVQVTCVRRAPENHKKNQLAKLRAG